MTDCVRADLRDALPDLIHDHFDPARTAEVEAHVAGCAECAAELDLLRVALASAPAAPVMDVARIAAALPTPTRHGFVLHRGGASTEAPAAVRPTRRGIWSRPSLRIAATLAVVTAGGLSLLVGRDVLNPETQVGQSKVAVGIDAARPGPATEGASSAPSQATGASESERQVVTASNDIGLSLVGDVQELSDEHLATLVDEMDRIEAIPGEEPDALTPVVGDSESIGAIR
jgi:hypothetical protein